MSSPYDRLIDDHELESMGEYARILLAQPDELTHVHDRRLAEIVRALYRHIRAVEEINILERGSYV
jgi:hypothetical protein